MTRPAVATLVALSFLFSHGCTPAEAFQPSGSATVNCYAGTNGAAAVVVPGFPVSGRLSYKEGILTITDATTGNVTVALGNCIAS